MEALTINIKNKKTSEKILGFLARLENEGVEIIAHDDLEDLKLLSATRGEESISFEDYLNDEHRRQEVSG
jgi:hypothetical protein